MLKKNILIVDDELDILNLIETVLKKEGFTNIFKASSGSKALDLFNLYNMDLVVLDIMLGDIEGYELCRKIREVSLIPILFLSAKNEELDKILGFTIGGDDYITKPFSPKELAYRIKAHLRRRQHIDMGNKSSILEKGIFYLDMEKGIFKKESKLIELKPKEIKLIDYFLKNDNYIRTKEQIYENVWGDYYNGDYDSINNSIMVHIRNLRKKIEENPSNPKYLLTLKGLGYKFISGEDNEK